MKTHHTKPVKTSSQLQCSICQDKFSDQDEMTAHVLTVDCTIRCNECLVEFESKALRQQHQMHTHPEETVDCIYMEIDEAMWKAITKNLKDYTDSLRKGKSRADAALDNWVAANIARFEEGRTGKAKGSGKLELGQWYTVYKTLLPQAQPDNIPKHPCKYT